MGLLSWSGRGWVGFLLIFGAAAAGVLVPERYSVLVIGLGFVVAGGVMFVLGRAWNGDGEGHRFCNMRMQKWVYVLVPLGLLLTFAGFERAKLEDPRKPSVPRQHL